MCKQSGGGRKSVKTSDEDGREARNEEDEELVAMVMVPVGAVL